MSVLPRSEVGTGPRAVSTIVTPESSRIAALCQLRHGVNGGAPLRPLSSAYGRRAVRGLLSGRLPWRSGAHQGRDAVRHPRARARGPRGGCLRRDRGVDRGWGLGGPAHSAGPEQRGGFGGPEAGTAPATASPVRRRGPRRRDHRRLHPLRPGRGAGHRAAAAGAQHPSLLRQRDRPGDGLPQDVRHHVPPGAVDPRELDPQGGQATMKTPPIVSPQEWDVARQDLLVEEKKLTRARDALAAKRRRMPWMAVEKEYRFDGPEGPVSLLDLFEGRRQLVVYRAFYAPDVTTYPQGGGAYPERACIGCSFLADQVAHPAHLNARDTTLAFVSRAPQAEIQGLKERMGWELIPWYTITDDFDKDFGVDEWHGTNAFVRDGERIYRTYFVNSRGAEAMGSTWSYLDITALGRQEEWEDSPEGYPQTPPYAWWNYHDAYGKTP